MGAEPVRKNRLLLSRITSDQTQNGEVAGSSGIAARALGDFGNVNGEQLDECGVISDGNLNVRLIVEF